MNFEELYQDIVLDHSRRPRNFGELPDAQVHVRGDNPMCGDEVTIHLHVGEGEVIDGLKFTGNGCSICMASASMMTQRLRNRTRAEAVAMADSFHGMLTDEKPVEPDERLGDLRVLGTVRKFPQRVKCATLPWHALKEAIAASAAGEKDRQISIE